MKYENLYPYEKLLPDLEENAIQEIVESNDYTIEANEIADSMNEQGLEVNIPDAIVFFRLGYEYARNEINKKLKEI